MLRRMFKSLSRGESFSSSSSSFKRFSFSFFKRCSCSFSKQVLHSLHSPSGQSDLASKSRLLSTQNFSDSAQVSFPLSFKSMLFLKFSALLRKNTPSSSRQIGQLPQLLGHSFASPFAFLLAVKSSGSFCSFFLASSSSLLYSLTLQFWQPPQMQSLTLSSSSLSSIQVPTTCFFFARLDYHSVFLFPSSFLSKSSWESCCSCCWDIFNLLFSVGRSRRDWFLRRKEIWGNQVSCHYFGRFCNIFASFCVCAGRSIF